MTISKHGLDTLNIPLWLEYLPPGEYTLTQVTDYVVVCRLSVYLRFNALGLERKRMREHPENTKKSGRLVDVYVWPGAEYFVKKKMEDKLESIRKKSKLY